MYCKECGYKIADDSKFCSKCGKLQDRKAVSNFANPKNSNTGALQLKQVIMQKPERIFLDTRQEKEPLLIEQKKYPWWWYRKRKKSSFYFISILLGIIIIIIVSAIYVSKDELVPPSESTSASNDEPASPTKNSFTDQRDGRVYESVEIGNQIWMAENLNFEAKGSKCYENKPENCEKYGRLYNWTTAKNVCPSGWHLPSKNEYEVLDNAVGGKEVAGKKLKAKSGWNNYKGKSGNGTNEFGFSALPGGYGFSDGSFFNVGNYGNWWSTSESSSYNAYSRYIGYIDDDADWNGSLESNLYSVRCLQD